MRKLAVIAILLMAGLFLFTCVRDAQAQTPFLPGQVKSEQMAVKYWTNELQRPFPCATVGVSPLGAPFNIPGRIGYTPMNFGPLMPHWYGVTCQVELAANIYLYGYGEHALNRLPVNNRQKVEQRVCENILHEFGHVAGYYDPVGYLMPDGTRDHLHSPDPASVMYPWSPLSAACANLFPFPKAHKAKRRYRPDAQR